MDFDKRAIFFDKMQLQRAAGAAAFASAKAGFHLEREDREDAFVQRQPSASRQQVFRLFSAAATRLPGPFPKNAPWPSWVTVTKDLENEIFVHHVTTK
jgi:hypothetical protein